MKKNATKKRGQLCEAFCKNDFMAREEELSKQSDLETGVPHKPLSSVYIGSKRSECKKTFCNRRCVGVRRSKGVRNGWYEPYYTPTKKKALMKKNALSGCQITSAYGGRG